MKINWFSPLPPARTDIGHYTGRVLPALAELSDITIWACQDTWDAELERFATVHRWSGDAWSALNQADFTIYHIGNNRQFHETVWEISRRHPGVVVMHDLCLQHLFLGIYLDHWRMRDRYVDIMETYYGAAGRRAAHRFFAGELNAETLVETWPLTEHALEGAYGVLVHTHDAYSTLAVRNRWPVSYIPLPYLATSIRPLHRSSDPTVPYRLTLFGYLGANRQLDKLLLALAGLPERQRFRLDIYGQLDDPEPVKRQIRTLDLTSLVHLHGFVTEEELDLALDQTTLAINLRYPSMGEASGSQLRIWNHALPSVVTRTGWYATLPETTVAFVRPGYEVADLQTHLQMLLAHPDRFARLGQMGRQLLEEQHAPDRYAQALCEFLPIAHRHCGISLLDLLLTRLGNEAHSFPQSPAPKDLHRLVREIHLLAGIEPAPNTAA